MRPLVFVSDRAVVDQLRDGLCLLEKFLATENGPLYLSPWLVTQRRIPRADTPNPLETRKDKFEIGFIF
jgi:hypothetical protein